MVSFRNGILEGAVSAIFNSKFSISDEFFSPSRTLVKRSCTSQYLNGKHNNYILHA